MLPRSIARLRGGSSPTSIIIPRRRTMNEKSSVSKELNDKHKKILEGLVKLPGNRECADCKSKALRWESINLGIFMCIQCSGIHRSLGVHISKVRSTTFDTWLPEQVSFMQSTGNEKSNSYWEAELPPDFKRDPIEKFIRKKYVEKRWIPKKASKSVQESTMQDSSPNQCPESRWTSICVSNQAVVSSSGQGEVLNITRQKNNSETHERLRQAPSLKMSHRRRSSLDGFPKLEVDKVPRIRSQSVDVKNNQLGGLSLTDDMNTFSGYSGWATFESEDAKFALQNPGCTTLKSHSTKEFFSSGLDIFKDFPGKMVKEEATNINSKYTMEDGHNFLKSNSSSSHAISKSGSQVPTTEEKMRSTSGSNLPNNFPKVAGHGVNPGGISFQGFSMGTSCSKPYDHQKPFNTYDKGGDSRSPDSAIDLPSSSNPKHVPRNGSTESYGDLTSLANICSKTTRRM